MTSRDFCYWLQGYFEIHEKTDPDLTVAQIRCIKKHLALVFKHEIDPSMGDAARQAELNAIHERENATIEDLKKDVEDLKKRPPQKVVHHDHGSGLIRC